MQIDGQKYNAHRIAWLHYYGSWPSSGLDHRDTDRSNNAIHNLRLASQSQNTTNRRSKRIDGRKGITYSKRRRKWIAQATVNGKVVYLGQHDTADAAHAAYAMAALAHHGEFARLS